MLKAQVKEFKVNKWMKTWNGSHNVFFIFDTLKAAVHHILMFSCEFGLSFYMLL